MIHSFRISTINRSRVVNVEGTKEYALSYVAGYIQAMSDKMNLGELVKIDVHELKDKP